MQLLNTKTGLTRGVKNVIGLKRPAPYEVDLQTTDWFINLVEKFNSGKLSLIDDLAERQASFKPTCNRRFISICKTMLFRFIFGSCYFF